MMNEKRREDMARRIAAAGRYRSFEGATVLEIGADKEGFAAQMLVDAGARHVISTNFGAKWPHEVNGPIERMRLDARYMPATFPAGSVDIVFGVAVLEHIDRLDMFFEGARHVLNEAGIMYAHGGPIWTSAKGHHVGLKGEAMHYRFGNPQTNPIRDWSHLVLDKKTLAEDLVARDVPPGDAAAIAEQIYEADDRNRIGYRAMGEIFDASHMTLIDKVDAAFKGPPPEMLEAIERGPWGGQGRYEVSGITFVARR